MIQVSRKKALSCHFFTPSLMYLCRLKHCLQADQTRVTDPSYKLPFQSVEDALSRLLPYHVYSEEIPPDIEWHKGENYIEKSIDEFAAN